jgi:hypothetical protein
MSGGEFLAGVVGLGVVLVIGHFVGPLIGMTAIEMVGVAFVLVIAIALLPLALGIGALVLLWLGITRLLPSVAGVVWETTTTLLRAVGQGVQGAVLEGGLVDLGWENVRSVAISGAVLGALVGFLRSRRWIRRHAAETALSEASPSLFTRTPEAFGGWLLSVVVGLLVGAFTGASGATGPANFVPGVTPAAGDVVGAWASPLMDWWAASGGGGGGWGGGFGGILSFVLALAVLALAVLLLSTMAGILVGIAVSAVQGAILGIVKGLPFGFFRAWFVVSPRALSAGTLRASMAEGVRTGAACGAILGLVHGVATAVAKGMTEGR